MGDVKISLEKIPDLANAFLGFIKPILGLNKKRKPLLLGELSYQTIRRYCEIRR